MGTGIRGFAAMALMALSASAWAISPYIQGNKVAAGSAQAAASAVEAKLQRAGFRVVGKYFPKGLPDHGVVIATDEAALRAIGQAGGPAILGAGIRVGVKSDGSVSYAKSEYWHRAYLRKAYAKSEGTVGALQSRLAGALGAGAGQGGDVPAESLANYRYMVGMERLESYKSLRKEYGSFEAALQAVRENLAAGAGGASKAYEVVLPDRELAVFGVAMSGPAVNDGEWIRSIGTQDSVAGLPYEIYVVGGKVSAPHARFRIALAFPGVTMGQFMGISALPTSIMSVMDEVAGADKNEDEGSAWGQ